MQRTASLSTRILAVVLSVALAVSFTCVGNLGRAQAAEGAATVTLTIVAGSTTNYETNETSYNVWVNKNYTVSSGATVVDLLTAAQEAGDITSYDGYESTYGYYLTGITSANGQAVVGEDAPDYSASLYWSLLIDGEYANTGFGNTTLETGHSYQVMYTTYTTVSTPASWDAFYAEHPVDVTTTPAAQGATLTVVAGSTTNYETYETSYNLWANKSYAITEGATVVDLLSAAKEAGDIADYAGSDSSYGYYLESITSSNGQTVAGWNSADYSTSLYWSLLVDGVYSSTGLSNTPLEAGHSYQLVYDFYTSATAPTDWPAFYAENPPTTISLASATVSGITAKTYTGKALTQNVKVTVNGTTLVNGTDYTVAYKSNKSVGTATVAITGVGLYGGTVTKAFKITPKATTVKSLAKGSKKIAVTWKKAKSDNQIDGYQVRYSTKKSMAGATKKTIKGAKKTSKVISKLKGKKRYYVQVRTYKTVNGVKYCSAWSVAKHVKTKK